MRSTEMSYMKSREAARTLSYIRRTIHVMLSALLGRAHVLEVGENNSQRPKRGQSMDCQKFKD